MSGGLILPGGTTAPAKKEQDPKADYEALSDEQKAALDALAEKENPEDLYEKVEFAFLVVKNPDGSFGITNDLSPKIAPSRTADQNDYLAAFKVIESNIQAQQTAILVQQGMMQQAAAMQQASQAAAIRQRLNLG